VLLTAYGDLQYKDARVVPQASVNRGDGTTQSPRIVDTDNRNVDRPQTVIDISQLSDSARAMALSVAAKYPEHFSLK
jgi:hypothetical protein